ncbi:hypothetical protein ABZP36_013734 [Zizania latifolia]
MGSLPIDELGNGVVLPDGLIAGEVDQMEAMAMAGHLTSPGHPLALSPSQHQQEGIAAHRIQRNKWQMHTLAGPLGGWRLTSGRGVLPARESPGADHAGAVSSLQSFLPSPVGDGSAQVRGDDEDMRRQRLMAMVGSSRPITILARLGLQGAGGSCGHGGQSGSSGLRQAMGQPRRPRGEGWPWWAARK